jgi:hypothetical protein
MRTTTALIAFLGLLAFTILVVGILRSTNNRRRKTFLSREVRVGRI